MKTLAIYIMSVIWLALAVFSFYIDNDTAGWVSLAISQIWVVNV